MPGRHREVFAKLALSDEAKILLRNRNPGNRHVRRDALVPLDRGILERHKGWGGSQLHLEIKSALSHLELFFHVFAKEVRAVSGQADSRFNRANRILHLLLLS